MELHLSIVATEVEQANRSLDAAVAQLATALGPDMVSRDGTTLEASVGNLLRGRGWHLALAESCTGGLFTSRLTDVAGSSGYVRAAVIAYSYEDKTALLGVPAELLSAHGAVSEPVAVAMAEGIRERTHADVTIGITGIAGPGGGTETKPVGTVVIAVIVPDRPVYVRTYSFFGGRAMVKFQATQAALDRVRRMLTDAL